MDEVNGQVETNESELPPPPPKNWRGRPIEYKEISYGRMKGIRKMNDTDREAALLTLLAISFYYVDDNTRVFPNGMKDIDDIPAKFTNLLIRHAGESMKVNMPDAVNEDIGPNP
jgi:hypothetical protein